MIYLAPLRSAIGIMEYWEDGIMERMRGSIEVQEKCINFKLFQKF